MKGGRKIKQKNLIRKVSFFGIIVIFFTINLSLITIILIKKEKASVDYFEKENFVYNKDETPISMICNVDKKPSSQNIKPRLFNVPSIVKKGDIAFCDFKFGFPIYHDYSGFSNDHVLIYVGNNRFIEATVIFPLIYKGSKGWDLCKLGVLKTSFAFLNLWATNIIFGTVRNASDIQRDNAVKWAETQIGQPYQFAFSPHWPYHIHSWWACSNPNGSTYNPDVGEFFIEEYPDYWFCTELVWAAYKHCNGDSGIDIGAKWEYDRNDDSWHWRVPTNYLLGNYEQVYFYTDGDCGNPGNGKPLIESFDVNVSSYGVTIYGKLLDDGGEKCHCYIYLIGEGNLYCCFVNRNSTEIFSKIVNHLKPGKTYQWYAWAYNSFGESCGEIKSFTTLSLN